MARTKLNTNGGESKAEKIYLEFMKANCKEPFEWQYKFILQKPFNYTRFNGENKKHMAITFTPDLVFHQDKFCIDFKGGVIDNTYKIKCKLLTNLFQYDIIEIVEAPKWFSQSTSVRYMTFKLKEELAKIKKELYPVVMVGKKKVVTKYTPDVIENVLSKVKLKYNKKYLFAYSVKADGTMDI